MLVFESTSSVRPDVWEKLGNFCTEIFHSASGFGYTVTAVDPEPDLSVERIDKIRKYHFTFQKYTRARRITAIVIGVILLPILPLLVVLGRLAYRMSLSHREVRKDFMMQAASVRVIRERWLQYCNRRNTLTRTPFVDRKFYYEYSKVCDGILEGTRSERIIFTASSLNVTTYLPQALPELILRKIGTSQAKDQLLHRVNLVDALNQMGIRHLIVPKSSMYKDFLIEERLSTSLQTRLSLSSLYQNLHVYYSDPNAFNEAVREMLKLLSRYSIQSMLVNTNHVYQECQRYDGTPLFLDSQGKGNIALAIPDQIEPIPQENPVETLVQMFPLHAEIIKKEAVCLGLGYSEEKEQEAYSKGMMFFRDIIVNHAFWLQKKGISPQNNILDINLGKHKVILKERLVECFEQLNAGGCGVFFTQREGGIFRNSKSMNRIAEEAVSKLLRDIEHVLTSHHRRITRGGKLSPDQLLHARSPVFRRTMFYHISHEGTLDLYENGDSLEYYFEQLYRNLEIDLHCDLSQESLARCCTKLALEAFNCVMQGLVEQGEILHFGPCVHLNAEGLCWLKY